MAAISMLDARSARKPRSAAKIAVYALCRQWHGYLSAFAFLALIFFSASGILLNHPEWLSDAAGPVQNISGAVPATALAAARKTADPGAALGLLVTQTMPVLGAYNSADLDDRQAFLRFEGVKGSSDVTVDLASGVATGRVHPADALTIMDDLHRGKNVGKVWQGVIDATGGIVLLLSLLGYVLFFAMRFRLRTSLLLTAISLGVLVGIFIFFVP